MKPATTAQAPEDKSDQKPDALQKSESAKPAPTRAKSESMGKGERTAGKEGERAESKPARQRHYRQNTTHNSEKPSGVKK
jgi:hypothetical protein